MFDCKSRFSSTFNVLDIIFFSVVFWVCFIFFYSSISITIFNSFLKERIDVLIVFRLVAIYMRSCRIMIIQTWLLFRCVFFFFVDLFNRIVVSTNVFIIDVNSCVEEETFKRAMNVNFLIDEIEIFLLIFALNS